MARNLIRGESGIERSALLIWANTEPFPVEMHMEAEFAPIAEPRFGNANQLTDESGDVKDGGNAAVKGLRGDYANVLREPGPGSPKRRASAGTRGTVSVSAESVPAGETPLHGRLSLVLRLRTPTSNREPARQRDVPARVPGGQDPSATNVFSRVRTSLASVALTGVGIPSLAPSRTTAPLM